ncbi:MAG TPA: multicopper oxidase domain-containing protein [Longimicrobiaceae bacterium]|nr:multicopper oxidase domain-containing protein [Longimicrobiaceae bacterium]
MTKHPHPGGRFPSPLLAAVFLVLEIAACAHAVAPPPEAPRQLPQVAPPPAVAPAPADSFPQPIEVSSVNGLLDVRMQVVRATFNIPGSKGGVQSLRAYQLLFPSAGPAGQPALYDVARDGVQFAPANYDTAAPDDSLYLSPGNRLDVFVRAPGTPGDYALHARPLTSRSSTGRQSRKEDDPALAAQLRQPLMTFRVVAPGATAYNTRLPPSLPPLPDFLRNVGRTGTPAVVVFTDSLTFDPKSPPQRPTRFFLGTAQTPYMKYDPTQVYYPTSATGARLPMVLADSQTWTILNYSTELNHPFHIHISPFQVVAVSAPDTTKDPFGEYYAMLDTAARKGAPLWMDVVPLPRAGRVKNSAGRDSIIPGSVTIRQRYGDFAGCPDCGPPTGQFVMHCHILGHEERGMMQLIQIFPSRSAVPQQRRGADGGSHRH